MGTRIPAVLTVVVMLVFPGTASAQGPPEGTEEFGLTRAQLVQAVEKVEALLSRRTRKR